MYQQSTSTTDIYCSMLAAVYRIGYSIFWTDQLTNWQTNWQTDKTLGLECRPMVLCKARAHISGLCHFQESELILRSLTCESNLYVVSFLYTRVSSYENHCFEITAYTLTINLWQVWLKTAHHDSGCDLTDDFQPWAYIGKASNHRANFLPASWAVRIYEIRKMP